jgi:hypothetical protein
MKRTLLLIATAAGCGNTDADAPARPAPAAALAHATAADLAHEIADAARLGTWRDVQHRWQGQHVQWAVTRQRLLCGAADDCNVAAFPIQRPAKQGWMPALAFAPGQYEALAAACGDREPCELTVAGTLSALDVSPELPIRVALTDVRIVSSAVAGR